MEVHQKISDVIAKAWEEKDFDLLAENLAESLEWYEDVFDPPLTTRNAVIEEWRAGLAIQTDIQVKIILLDSVDNRSYHRCKASWRKDTGELRKIDALYVITLDSEDKIISFLPWYTSRES